MRVAQKFLPRVFWQSFKPHVVADGLWLMALGQEVQVVLGQLQLKAYSAFKK